MKFLVIESNRARRSQYKNMRSALVKAKATDNDKYDGGKVYSSSKRRILSNTSKDGNRASYAAGATFSRKHAASLPKGSAQRKSLMQTAKSTLDYTRFKKPGPKLP